MKSLYKIVSYIMGVLLMAGAVLLNGTSFHGLPIMEILSVYLICLVLCPLLSVAYSKKLWNGLLGTFAFILLSGGIIALLVLTEYLFGARASLIITALLPALLCGVILVNSKTNSATEITENFYTRGVKPSVIKRFVWGKYAYGMFFRFSGLIFSVISAIVLISDVLLSGTSFTVQQLISLGLIIVAIDFSGYLLFLLSGCEYKQKEFKKTGLFGIIVFGLLFLSVALIIAYLFFVRQHLPVFLELQAVSDVLSRIFAYSAIAVAGGWTVGTVIGLLLGIMGKIGRNLTALLNGFSVIPPYILTVIILSYIGGDMGVLFALGFYVLVYCAVACSEAVSTLKSSRDARFYLKKGQYFRSFVSHILISDILKSILISTRDTLYNMVFLALIVLAWWKESSVANYSVAAALSVVLLIFNILCFIVKGERQNG